ncbi:DsbA family protein [Rapidithrix thailandica]|uniref:DsbA family protein n=1 Tax=Rapidithrix thailandica TaxID=413964 RepID=A0AAW9S7W2_9BACT
MKEEIIYIGDPMCSWCYGMVNELDKLMSKYQDRFPFRTVVGGLRPYETQPMDQKMRDFLKDHWQEVHTRTQQPFDFRLLESAKGFVYNTEKPCRAIVTVRHFIPEKAHAYFKAIQSAFYAKAIDITQDEVLIETAKSLGINPIDFNTYFQKESTRKETYDDFTWAQQIGVTGFPSVILSYNQELFALALGYRTFEDMDEIIRKIID